MSRQTFYQLYGNKLDCFLDALDLVGEVLLAQLGEALGQPGEPLQKAAAAVETYLATLGDHPAFARLYIVEVHAAGPAALLRRSELQARVVDALASLLHATGPRSRFACEAFVAAVSALVTVPLVTGDRDALDGLRDPLVEHLRSLVPHD